MMIVSITEEQPTNIGYQTRSPSCGLSRAGWGSSLSRKSYKTNLSGLVSGLADMDASDEFSIATPEGSDEWGFFVDAR